MTNNFTNYKFHSSLLDSIISKRGIALVGTDRLAEIFAKEVYNYQIDTSNKYTERGIYQESDSISLYRAYTQSFVVKNTKKRETQSTVGALDIYDENTNTVIDIKTAYSLIQFLSKDQKAMEKDYLYQVFDYCRQIKAENPNKEFPAGKIAYCLPDWGAEQVIRELNIYNADMQDKIYAFYANLEDWNFGDFDQESPFDQKVVQTITQNTYSRYMPVEQRVRIFDFQFDVENMESTLESVCRMGREHLQMMYNSLGSGIERKKKTSMTKSMNYSLTDKIISKLAEFKMPLEYVDTVNAASVVQYRYRLVDAAVKIDKVKRYEADLQAVLEVGNVSVQAPISGTDMIGVTVPREDRQTLPFPADTNTEGLNVLLGQDVNGEDYKLDIAKAPHVLVAGATGSGKSVLLKNIINQLQHQEQQVTILDPKNEFQNSIRRHKDIFLELENYQNIIEKSIEGEKLEQKHIIVLDEMEVLFADAVFGKISKQIIEYITRIGRSEGVHMILATQNPIVKNVSSSIKANCPTRICLRVASETNSSVILDQSGGEKLLGAGDMLLMNPAESQLVRLQGYYS